MNNPLNWINEIYNFLEDYSGIHPESPDIDIFKDLGVTGDDFHEMIDKYSKNYRVDMSNYLWYFHADEEGQRSIGGFFFKPPYERVKRIPVTPRMLSDFIVTKKWEIEYPEHKVPKRRIDLIINLVILILISITLIRFLMN